MWERWRKKNKQKKRGWENRKEMRCGSEREGEREKGVEGKNGYTSVNPK